MLSCGIFFLFKFKYLRVNEVFEVFELLVNFLRLGYIESCEFDYILIKNGKNVRISEGDGDDMFSLKRFRDNR